MFPDDGRNYTVLGGVLAFTVLGLLATVHDSLTPLFVVGVVVLVVALLIPEKTSDDSQ